MMRPLLPLILFLVFLSACSGEKKVQNKEIDLFFTCDIRGRIEPCGCFTGQYGGLTRISSFLQIQQEKAEALAKPEAIVSTPLKLDVGGAIAGREDYHIFQHRYLLKAMGEMGFDAANLGGRETALSAGVLSGIVRESPVPIISANVYNEAGSALVAQPFVIVKKNGLRVGITGVVDPKSIKPSTGKLLDVREMRISLRSLLPELDRKSDMLILLAFTDESGLRELAREFFEFDIILGGDVLQPTASPEKVNQSWIAATTNQARALGELHALFNPEKKSISEMKGTVSLMIDAIPQDPSIAGFASDYRDKIRTVNLAVDNPDGDASNLVPGVKPGATFSGSPSCAECHPETFANWQKSGHARAFDSLVREESEADPSCIKCHVVGFGEPGGYLRSMAEERRLVQVGCESCHGPGSQHIEVRRTGLLNPGEPVYLKMRGVGEGQCIQCHYGEFSRPFDWKKFWPLIEHGKE